MPDITRLLEIMAALRTPKTGCPWDLEQDFSTIAPYTVEEAYEVADAIERKDYADLKDELGDLLLQVVFHAQMAKEESLFTFDDVVEAICDKLIRRHPHVFGDVTERNADGVNTIWQAQKDKEKAARQKDNDADEAPLLLSDVPRGMPALKRAQKIQKKAIRVKFDWEKLDDVFDKLSEEIDELKEAIESRDKAAIHDELGDLLFVGGVLGCWLDIDAEQALHDSNSKFTRRFGHLERALRARGKTFADTDLAEMSDLWVNAKKAEKNAA